MVRDFHRRGNDYKRLRTKPGPQPHPIPDDLHAYIRDSLHENRFLSTKERCQIINERFGFPMKERRLRRTYHRLGIKYAAVKTMLKARLTRVDYRRAERQKFAKKACSLTLQRRNVIYFDESSTNLWGHHYIKKTW